MPQRARLAAFGGTSKQLAADMVAKTLGVPAERCAAAGDAANDLSLLRWAKVRLTVANAIAPIRDMGTLL
ncbi:hypothetical protein EN803_42995, partial [Mesorhizobium sp. M2D.F.Ca.ET.160.01.1.1]